MLTAAKRANSSSILAQQIIQVGAPNIVADRDRDFDEKSYLAIKAWYSRNSQRS
jgi:hypothetical protein